MDTTRSAAQVRAPRGRPKMSFDRIIGEALALADEQGAPAMTLRALAQRLGSSTATLYRHVDSRTELVQHVVDRLFGEIQLDDGLLAGDDWARACERLATGFFDVMTRHRNAAALLAEVVPTGPRAMAYREQCLRVLLDAGVPSDTALRVTATLGRFVIGMAIQLPADHTTAASTTETDQRLRGADPERYPATSQSAGGGSIPLDEEFRTGLELILLGLAEVLKR